MARATAIYSISYEVHHATAVAVGRLSFFCPQWDSKMNISFRAEMTIVCLDTETIRTDSRPKSVGLSYKTEALRFYGQRCA